MGVPSSGRCPVKQSPVKQSGSGSLSESESREKTPLLGRSVRYWYRYQCRRRRLFGLPLNLHSVSCRGSAPARRPHGSAMRRRRGRQGHQDRDPGQSRGTRRYGICNDGGPQEGAAHAPARAVAPRRVVARDEGGAGAGHRGVLAGLNQSLALAGVRDNVKPSGRPAAASPQSSSGCPRM